MTVEWHGLSTAEVQAWADLVGVLAVADGTGESYGPEELAEELAEPGVDPALDVPGVFVDGQLVGYAQVRVFAQVHEGMVRTHIGGGVHPDFRGRGFGRRLMDLVEARAGLIAGQCHPGFPVLLRTSGGVQGPESASVRRLLEHRGYRPGRYFVEMRRPLPGDPLPEPSLAVVGYTPELSEPFRLAHAEAFSTHWGSAPRTAAEWQSLVGSSTFRPEATFLHLDQDGTVLAYSATYEEQPGELLIGQVGTRLAARGRGLARACLLASLRAAQQLPQYRLTKLEVDSENPTGAGALYASVGFEPAHTRAVYLREL